MAANPQFHSDLPREISSRVHSMYTRDDWGRPHVVTLHYDGIQLSTPAMHEIGNVVCEKHWRTILLLIGCVLPDKLHLILRAGSLTSGKFKRFDEAVKELKDTTSAIAVRALRQPGHLYTDRKFVRELESEEEAMEFALRIFRSPVVHRLTKEPMKYPHLLLP